MSHAASPREASGVALEGLGHSYDGFDAVVFGRSLAREPEAMRPLVGLVPQDISLYPELSAEENLALVCSKASRPLRHSSA